MSEFLTPAEQEAKKERMTAKCRQTAIALVDAINANPSFNFGQIADATGLKIEDIAEAFCRHVVMDETTARLK